MNSENIEKVLETEIFDEYIKSEDYISKYYLKKLLKRNFPSISEEIIYFAINFCNDIIKPPRKKKEYIKTLSRVLSEHSSRASLTI
ncbi:MAG: hypothetical protein CVV23_11950 [Ignavibacteriae bacterium HGW-Ignavibacteriae-2]|jgi:hypothetical protein|nr:hypothetical protein [Bacteroidota bacterium]PKL88099.1 MAG: hypothetical protein CVV23_11950 [Ignavibacteriae bacterium HGW-Ignavibacteriae-2]